MGNREKVLLDNSEALYALYKSIIDQDKEVSFCAFQRDTSPSLTINELQEYFKHVKLNYSLWKILVKRFFDILISFFGLILTFPLFIVVAIAIKIESKGPVFFKQERVGKMGKLFTFYKFRSMVKNAKYFKDALRPFNEMDGPCFKIKNDPRITKVGKFIRRTSIDELPQLWNVLKGEMSLIGPRPLPLDEVLKMELWHLDRFKVLPGITGIWQVNGRNNTSFRYWMESDIKYVKEWSLWLDLKLLIMTIPAVLFRIGAC